jgi:DNA processing protein
MTTNETKAYGLGITYFEQIGPARAKQLIAYCGGVEEVFTASPKALRAIPHMRPNAVDLLINERDRALREAQYELERMEHQGIGCVLYQDLDYPHRLKQCEDAPMVLFYKGMMDFNRPKILSVVGTRRATGYGKEFCQVLMKELQPLDVVIVSGLAHGIDGLAHRAALDVGLSTWACLGHGLNTLYPAAHADLARAMQEQGGLVTEFTTQQKMRPELFPMRNRLIAGMSDATLVVESDVKGGSMITAYLAHSYDREVFAVPGRMTDKSSQGCNELIAKQIAQIVVSPAQVVKEMNWSAGERHSGVQMELFTPLTSEQQQVMKAFEGQEEVSMDDLIWRTGIPSNALATLLLELEFAGRVLPRPGQRFEWKGSKSI